MLYYLGVVVMVRLAGKRLAGQMTTFDLIVLIGVAVVAQQVTLGDGRTNALLFVGTVLATHRGLARLAARWPRLRILLRGRPRTLVANGAVLDAALLEEGISEGELRAGLRKLGYGSITQIKLAVLEETGHISAIPFDELSDPGSRA